MNVTFIIKHSHAHPLTKPSKLNFNFIIIFQINTYLWRRWHWGCLSQCLSHIFQCTCSTDWPQVTQTWCQLYHWQFTSHHQSSSFLVEICNAWKYILSPKLVSLAQWLITQFQLQKTTNIFHTLILYITSSHEEAAYSQGSILLPGHSIYFYSLYTPLTKNCNGNKMKM